MASRVRLIVYLILVALFCGLCDGPFVDEVLADQAQQQMAQDGQADASKQQALVIVYATLMNAVDVSSSSPARLVATAQELPDYEQLRYAPPALCPPHKPPRSTV